MELFWTGRQFSGASFLFLINRYMTLVVQIVDVVPLTGSGKVLISISTICRSKLDISVEVILLS